jgi:hypothetical protein
MGTENKSDPRSSIARLKDLPPLLLELHKLLLDEERAEYEKVFGKVSSSGQMLKLVIEDPWFGWLRGLSQIIAVIDETLEAKTAPVTEKAAADLLAEIKKLLTPSEEGEGFAKEYFDALQRDPDVIFKHKEIARLVS